MNQNQRFKNRRTARALESVVKVEAEVKRLREAGWKKQDFAQALKNLIEEQVKRKHQSCAGYSP